MCILTNVIFLAALALKGMAEVLVVHFLAVSGSLGDRCGYQ